MLPSFALLPVTPICEPVSSSVNMLSLHLASVTHISSTPHLCSLPPAAAPPRTLPLLKIKAGAGKKRVPRTESHKVLNLRARKRLTGTSARPRLLVFCSEKHLYAQVIDDTKKLTLVSACTAQYITSAANNGSYSPVLDSAQRLGKELAVECQRQGISKVIYYRRGTLHWKRVKTFRLAAEEHGLELEYPD